ncbi:uncharacterized protein LTR77_010406 [Saxophila tyrrhenica]|uniref:Uncharacterized protein n=1 Tax=Saxophila tyrrhenica TaxID=1690608 RepID=A0AAV9NVG0_9PEZI|nr:hypothetical protein LTR77_010406 [Saxophila tyrrhenica]
MPLDSAAKENRAPRPAKMAKGKVSVGSLFDQQDRITKGSSRKDIRAPRDGGISKTHRPTNHFSQYTKPKKPAFHPAYLSFAETSNDYRSALGVANDQQLKPIHDELVARVDGFNVHSRTAEEASGLPTDADYDALGEDHAALSRLLDDDEMIVQTQHKDGTKTKKQVKLGDTMQAFEKMAATKRAELQRLCKDLKDVVAEISATRESIVATEASDVKRARKTFKAELASIAQDAGAVREQLHGEVEEARKDDQAFRAKIRKVFDQLMAEMDEME